MKKLFTVFLVVVIMLNILSFSSFAGDEKTATQEELLKKAAGEAPPAKLDAKSVETLIKLVKSKIDIPIGYDEFYSEVNSNSCRFRWSTKTNYYISGGGSVEVTVNEKGTIMSYNQYKFSREYDYQKRLPKLPKTEAFAIAKKFVYYINPDIPGQINFDTGLQNCTIENEGHYRFFFFRQDKSIPFYENGVSILINGNTGEVMDFSRNWKEGVTFPDAGKVIAIDTAKAAIIKKIPLELKYSRTYGEDIEKAYLKYSPAFSDLNCSIDAMTGEKVIENGINSLYSDSIYKSDIYRQENYGAIREINFTEEQLNDLKKREGLISAETAEKLARSMEEVGIDKTYTLNRSSYNTYINDNGYLIRLEFSKTLTKEDLGGDISEDKLKVMIASGEAGGNISITFNAKTSELISINSYGYRGNGSQKTVFDKKIVEKNIEAFMKKYKERKLNEAVIAVSTSQNLDYAMKYSGVYAGNENTFVYTRKVNGIPYEENQLIISFEPSTGKINNYIEKWDTLEFASKDKVIGLTKAYEALFKNNNIALKYATAQNAETVKLVYAYDSKKPICIDAEKGVLINYYNNEPFKAVGALRYNDINNSPKKEQIQALFEAGILVDEENFRPNDPILQKDWLYLINKVRNFYGTSGNGTLKQKELDGMYRTLINDGVIEEEEKNPDDKVLREVGVKYLLNSLGYKKFAELEGLFNCTFDDKAMINPKLVGYIAIAKSLKIIDVNAVNFLPKKDLTRGDAVSMLYNFLMR